ncbi:T9SS type A sorting domain-containing protein [Hymenobacter algoricola]|uniref:T9SS type A sorting domain-containing protein n=1 Tax=Hymenobacter algoricola TaxID=486267 RepID=A0ABP7MHZ5_9BACT
MFVRFHLLALLLSLLSAAPARAQLATSYVRVPPPGMPNSSNLSRGPDGSKDYHRAAAIYPAADVTAPAGTIVRSVGFLIRTPAATTATGTLRVWLRPTSDTNYSLAPDWSYLLQLPTPFQLVYDGPLTIPAAAGWIDLMLTNPYTHNGQGFYLAYEWVATAKSATGATYDTNSERAQAIRVETGQLPPPQLTQASAHRPVVRLGYDTPARDAQVVRLYAAGQLARQPGVLPHTVRAVVRNTGQQLLTNLPVTLTASATAGGSATYTVTKVVADLAPGAEKIVYLPGWAPTGTGRAYLRVSLPADDEPANNTGLDSVQVTEHELSYAVGNPPLPTPASGVGFGQGSGTMLCRMPLHDPTTVRAVRAYLSYQFGQNSVVFGIVLDEQGRLLARTPDHVVLDTERDRWLTLALPSPVLVRGQAFYFGLAQVSTPRPNGYFPLATQEEPFMRDSAYYSAAGDSALTGLKPPREIRTLGRFLLSADVTTGQPLAAAARQSELPLRVFPNPCPDGWLWLSAAGPWELIDMLGRRRAGGMLPAPAKASAEPSRLDLRGLPAGCYLLRTQTAAKRWQTTRLILQ